MHNESEKDVKAEVDTANMALILRWVLNLTEPLTSLLVWFSSAKLVKAESTIFVLRIRNLGMSVSLLKFKQHIEKLHFRC